jgi:hypothetical protein
MDTPPSSAISRAAILLEKQPVLWQPADGGYTNAERWVVSFKDGSSCFVKGAADAYTAGELRKEYNLVYSRLQAPFLPRLLGWDDDDLPLLVLEDLSHAHWPPPWSREQIDAVLRTMRDLHATRLPDLPPVDLDDTTNPASWATVAADPRDFLALGLCSGAWLRRALRSLLRCERLGFGATHQGDDTLHVDLRSDNVCFEGERVVLVDWNWAATGNGELDIAAWLPSLHSEGGPLPDELLPNAPHWAAMICGYFAARAGLPVIPHAPRVRQVQLAQLRSALPWVQRALGLPPLDGPKA